MDEHRAYLLSEYKIWVQRNGDPIPVEKMTDNHLVCTLRMLKRITVAGKDAALDQYIYAGPTIRMLGEMAQDAIENEFDRLNESEWHELIGEEAVNVLIEEAENRKLDWENSPWF
jgi:hypothetical protein